jgi:hypothetical protein
MRTVVRTALIAVKMFTIPATAGVVDPEPQLRTSLMWTANLLENENSTASSDRLQFRLGIPGSGQLREMICSASFANRLRHQIKARIANDESGCQIVTVLRYGSPQGAGDS